MKRLATLLLTIPLAVSSLVAVTRGTRHLALDWPVHARHHLVHGIALWFGLPLVALFLVCIPLQRGDAWAWWALVVAGVVLYGGYWLGNLSVGLGEPGLVPNTAQAVQAALYAVGLVLAWPHMRRG